MATSPQSSAQQYLIRAREQSHWDCRTSEAPASSERFLSRGRKPRELCAHQQEEKVWEEVRVQAGDVPKWAGDDTWRVGGAGCEARCLYGLLGRDGNDVHSLRQLIGVSAAEEVDLRLWIQCEPELRRKIESMIHFRQRVLAAFNALVENAQRRASAAAD
jgi:hypothetical protein